MVLREAALDGLVAENPATGVRPPKKDPPSRSALEVSEVRRLADALRTAPPARRRRAFSSPSCSVSG